MNTIKILALYRLILIGAKAIGLLLLGLSKPFNVLPRNSDMENFVNIIVITVPQAQQQSQKK